MENKHLLLVNCVTAKYRATCPKLVIIWPWRLCLSGFQSQLWRPSCGSAHVQALVLGLCCVPESHQTPRRCLCCPHMLCLCWGNALECFRHWLWICCVFGGGLPWSVRITHCYSVTSCYGHPRHVKARAQAQPGVPNLFFHRRAPLQMAHKRCKWRHERRASVVAGTNATLVRLPTPSHSCILAFGPREPLTEAICKELCSETSSGSPLLMLVLGHSHTCIVLWHPPRTSR